MSRHDLEPDGAWPGRAERVGDRFAERLPEQVWGHIRAGRGPTVDRVDAVAHAEGRVLGTDGEAQTRQAIRAATLGLGPLQQVVELPGVTDVLVNGERGVWIDRGEGLEHLDVRVGDAADVRRLAVRLAGLADRRLDESSPYVDGLLPGAIRLHAVLPPLVDGAAHISLRIPRADVVSLDRLVELESLPSVWVEVLRAIVDRRLSFVISGGTGTGKTTLLAAMLATVDPADRILVVEDVRELAVQHPHVIRMQSRPANVEGAGAVDMVALVRQSLRMRPDRLVVGEVRGAEVREMLTALNTGHEGGCGTVHANSDQDVLSRFEALGALADMSPQAVRAQLTSAISVVVHLRRTSAGRKVDSVGVLQHEGERLVVRTALRNPDTDERARGGAGEADQRAPRTRRERRLAREAPPGAQEPGWSVLRDLLGWDAVQPGVGGASTSVTALARARGEGRPRPDGADEPAEKPAEHADGEVVEWRGDEPDGWVPDAEGAAEVEPPAEPGVPRLLAVGERRPRLLPQPVIPLSDCSWLQGAA